MKASMRLFLISGILLLSGCGGVIDWTSETFDQGDTHKKDKIVISNYLKTKKIYDQFTTIALFDVLWLSDDIKTVYSNLYSKMHNRSEEVHQTFLRRQLKSNAHFISFYILSTHEAPLDIKPIIWSVSLKIDGKTYQPSSVKGIEMVPEYQEIFGKLLTNHKRPYEARFERKDNDGVDILDNAKEISLYLSGPKHYTSATWKITPSVLNDMKSQKNKVKV